MDETDKDFSEPYQSRLFSRIKRNMWGSFFSENNYSIIWRTHLCGVIP